MGDEQRRGCQVIGADTESVFERGRIVDVQGQYAVGAGGFEQSGYGASVDGVARLGPPVLAGVTELRQHALTLAPPLSFNAGRKSSRRISLSFALASPSPCRPCRI